MVEPGTHQYPKYLLEIPASEYNIYSRPYNPIPIIPRDQSGKALIRMGIQLYKYWHDIISPILRQEPPPTIPQAVVMRGQEVLLVKRDNPALWELPGGGMLPHETPEQTIVREVREETGIQTRIVALLGWYERTGLRPHLSPVYLAHPICGQLRPQIGEAIIVRYFTLPNLPYSLFPWYRSILLQDIWAPEPRPLHRTQHLGLRTAFHCLYLDIASRLAMFD